MHQLLQAQADNANALTSTSLNHQKSIQLNEIISLSSFEIVKNLRMPMSVYLILITFEFAYIITVPAQNIIFGNSIITTLLFEQMTAFGVYLFSIAMTTLMLIQTVFIVVRGKQLKTEQTKGNEAGSQSHSEGSIVYILTKSSGIFLTVLSTVLSQLFLRIIPENFSCDKPFEIQHGCNSPLKLTALYFSVAGIPLILFLIIYSDIFLTKLFPNEHLPWSAWNERSRLFRNLYKAIQVISITLVSQTYQIFVNFGVLFIACQIVYERYMIPQIYNRVVHIFMVFLECQLLVYTLMAFLVPIARFQLASSGLIYVSLAGIFLAILLILLVDKKESDILAMGTDLKNYENIFDVELYLVVMLHELERLIQDEEYAHEKHIHAIVGRHMEECHNENCPCKNYEPEYDKKFTTVFMSKRMTKSFSSGGFSAATSGQLYMKQQSVGDMKRLPYKINYKTKVEIFKKEFEDRVESFLEEYPKSYGIKLLKSFFNHKYCDSSYKALFVQLENSITCKNLKGKIFIYHLKTQIQDEMKKSTESPLTIDINSLLRLEKHKMDFERNLEDLSFNCQIFWTDLTKDDYKVDNALKVADSVSSKIIKIKELFSKIFAINPLCIDTASTYALVYRHILRDEAAFNDLVNRIQQIKNSFKLELQREVGIRFFDSDIYGLLMVSGEIKELGRIKQSNSSVRFVFGYDPKDLVGSRINKLMPGPFAQIHDRFMLRFLSQGKSNFLDRNQPLAVITKEGFLQMTLFYIKPMVSLEFGLIFSCFARKLNQYTMADDAPELVKLHKLCVILTDSDGFIHGMSESCSKRMGIPTPNIGQQLSINDNQMFNISSICPQILSQDYEFELNKGSKMDVSTKFLKKERQFRREYPEIACKIGEYKAEVGVHKFQYRDLKQDINIYVIKLADKLDFMYNGQKYLENDSQRSKSGEDEELTYSEFSITTANSSVLSSQLATSKFKTFKSKIQQLDGSSQIDLFQKLTLITFVLLLGIAAGNFAINIVKNQSFMQNLDVVTNLQILLQQVPDSAHSARQLVLLSNNLVKQKDSVIEDYKDRYPSKYAFYADSLYQGSYLFEEIQNHLQTSLKSLIQLDQYKIKVKDVKTDGDIKEMSQSIQTAINLFSSKTLKLASFKNGAKGQGQINNNTVIPKISFQWNNSALLTAPVSDQQQDIYFIIENGLGSIAQGIRQVLQQIEESIAENSSQASIISIILATISIFLVLVLLPMSYQPLTHVERISQLILMSLNRLPEKFCFNETKACMEIILFLNEQKDGEKSTHEMIKKHDHRKHNRQLLKLPKSQKNPGFPDEDSMWSSNLDSDTLESHERNMLLQGKMARAQGDTKSTNSRESSLASGQSRATQLSKVKANNEPLFHMQRIKRNEGGNIELDLMHAKTSEIQDDGINEDQDIEGKELTEEEQLQLQREQDRQNAIKLTFKGKKIQKFCWLIVTAIVISLYYGCTCFYLSLIHQYEKIYLDQYSLIGRRIQCYTNVVTYQIDSLGRNSDMSLVNNQSNNAAWFYLQDCFKQEQDYKQMLLDGLTKYSLLDTFNQLNDNLEGSNLCQILSTIEDVDGLKKRNITLDKCLQVYNGILTNGGLTENLFHFLKNLQDIMILFEDRKAFINTRQEIDIVKELLQREETNDLISLNQIYLRTAFEYLRTKALSITQAYFTKLNGYYNMLFGLFVSFLTIFQIMVTVVFVKRLQKQIVKMYHVVLLIPLSGRTQNDLNDLMLVKM